jgi:hypothetical protein
MLAVRAREASREFAGQLWLGSLNPNRHRPLFPPENDYDDD